MNKQTHTVLEEIQGTVEDIIKQLRAFIRKGNAKRVMIKNKHGKILFQSQLTLGAAGALFFIIYAPVITALTTLAAVASDVSVWVEAEEESPEKEDSYEVDAEVIEIKDEENEPPSGEDFSEKTAKKDDAAEEKTVGRKKE